MNVDDIIRSQIDDSVAEFGYKSLKAVADAIYALNTIAPVKFQYN